MSSRLHKTWASKGNLEYPLTLHFFLSNYEQNEAT